MRISVIIPNYNHARYLDERIRSILSQTRRPDELILLDDASQDESLAVASHYDCFDKVIVNQENSGYPFKQWLKGIAAAEGDYIWIAESDDACEPQLLERLSAAAERSGAVLSFCRSTEIGPDGRNLGIQRYQRDLTGDFTLPGPEFIRRYLSRNNLVANASAALFRRDAALAVDPSFAELRGAGDLLFWCGIAAQGPVTFVSEPLNLFRRHGDSRTAEDAVSGRGLHEACRVCREMRDAGWLSAGQYRARVADTRYRLLYGFPGLPEEVRAEALAEWSGGLGVDIAVKMKRLKRRIWK